MHEFSIVVAISVKDLNLLAKTLPSWPSIGSSDIIICTDNPAPKELNDTIMKITTRKGVEKSLRILQVGKKCELQVSSSVG